MKAARSIALCKLIAYSKCHAPVAQRIEHLPLIEGASSRNSERVEWMRLYARKPKRQVVGYLQATVRRTIIMTIKLERA